MKRRGKATVDTEILTREGIAISMGGKGRATDDEENRPRRVCFHSEPIVDHVVLGHARPKLLRTYMPTLPLGEARDALQKWGEELDRIVGADASARGVELARGADRSEAPAGSSSLA